MAGTTPELMRLGLEIVGANEPCKPGYLRRVLRQNGASVRAANETVLFLIRDGHVRRTWSGKLRLRNERAGGG
jgi:hypothetical protein